MSEKVMLCDSSKELPIGDFIYQMKYDGCRCIADLRNNETKLTNRRGENISKKYFDLDLKSAFWNSCIIDGEICVLKDGKPNFNLLQHREHIKTLIEVYAKIYPVVFYVFDILEFEGESLIGKPLSARLKILKENFHKSKNVFLAETYEGERGKELWDYIKQERIEGIVSKAKDSIYEFRRSPYWIKTKIKQTADLDVVGFTSNKREISALVTPYGNVNFSLPKHLYDLWTKELKNYALNEVELTAFLIEKGIFKIEVEYLELTNDNKMRFPKLIKIWKLNGEENDEN